jgi:hypothetical protein
MRFYLFILVNAVLFLRPGEIIPELEGARLYEMAILACLAVSVVPVLRQLSTRSLVVRPITLCVLGLFVAVVLSHLSHLYFYGTWVSGVAFAKIVLYYLLLVGIVNSEARLREFLGWLAGFLVVLTVLALVQYHQIADIPGLAAFQQKVVDKATGETHILPRLMSVGIFQDPNDLSLVLVWGILISLNRLGERGPRRMLWLAALVVFGYALTQTYSRGGFIAFLTGLLVFLWSRFGAGKSFLITALLLPIVVVLFAGRQTSFDFENKEDTSQYRIRLWSDGLVLMRESPLFGIGMGMYAERAEAVAHNSFVQAYTELGLVGGAFFLGAFVFALARLRRPGSVKARSLSPGLRRLRPYLLAMVASLAAGLMSLSRNYSPAIYTLFGVVTVYLNLTASSVPALVPRVNQRLILRFLLVGVIFLPVMYVFVTVFARWN